MVLKWKVKGKLDHVRYNEHWYLADPKFVRDEIEENTGAMRSGAPTRDILDTELNIRHDRVRLMDNLEAIPQSIKFGWQEILLRSLL